MKTSVVKKNMGSTLKKPAKSRVTITITDNVKTELEEIGNRYGLKISNMLERAAEYYLSDIKDLEIAKSRFENPKGVRVNAEEAKKLIMED